MKRNTFLNLGKIRDACISVRGTTGRSELTAILYLKCPASVLKLWVHSSQPSERFSGYLRHQSQLISVTAKTVQHQVLQKLCFCNHYPPNFWRFSICGTVAWNFDLQQLCLWPLWSFTPTTSTVTPWPECMFTGNLLMHIYWCTLFIFIIAEQSSLEIAGFYTPPIFPHTTLFYLKCCRKPCTLTQFILLINRTPSLKKSKQLHADIIKHQLPTACKLACPKAHMQGANRSSKSNIINCILR